MSAALHGLTKDFGLCSHFRLAGRKSGLFVSNEAAGKHSPLGLPQTA
jgi:hypothetical protein